MQVNSMLIRGGVVLGGTLKSHPISTVLRGSGKQGTVWVARGVHSSSFRSPSTSHLWSSYRSHTNLVGKRVTSLSSCQSAFLILARHESSSVTQIPPLASNVFSRQDAVSGGVSGTSDTSPVAANVVDPVLTTAAAGDVGGTVGSEKIENVISISHSQEIDKSQAVGGEVSSESLVWESIPEPPSIPLTADDVTGLVLNAAGEPTFTSLGLGGWYPPGIVQQCLEYFHVNIGLPWWGSILLGTLCVRLLVFPLVVKSQRNAAKMQNNMPQMQSLQLKMTEARQSGNSMMAAKYGQDMVMFMKEKDISPFKSVLVPFAMAPIFISFFFGLRKMANLPVDSLREGGLWWFMDLTVADPYCLLPLMTSLTLWITMEVGVDGVQLSASSHGQTMKYVLRAIPVIMFPFTMNFPAAILCYWVSTNAISLVQVSLLKIPKVRNYLSIEPVRKFTPDTLPIKKKGFVDSFKDSWTNVKITKEMEDRNRFDEISFKRAGKGPIPKTYKYDPTRASSPVAVQAKQKR